MKHPTPEQKHSILTHYAARREGETLARILALHDVVASRQAVALWRQQWDGTIASLQRKPVAGRPRILTPAEVRRHVAAPIRNANRAAREVRYTKLLPQVRAATGKSMSVRTLRNYGETELNAKQHKGKKRTAEESEYTNTQDTCNACRIVEYLRRACVRCLCTTFSVCRHVR
jgi:hypothetical protein